MRAALYVRVSTEEQRLHGLSIEAQTMALKEWAAQQGHDVVGIYNDAGISARKPAKARPQLQQLLQDIQSGAVDLVAFTKLDRWFRNVKEYYKVQEVLDKYKVPWVAVQEDYETATASGRFKTNIMLAVAEQEADRTGERIKAIIEMKRAKGEVAGGKPPTGYRVSAGKYVIDSTVEEAVRFFLKRYMDTAELMNTADIVRQTYGLHLTYRKMYGILSNPIFAGHAPYGDCPSYITDDEFDRIQQMRGTVVQKAKDDRVYIFSGLLFCAECGGRYKARGNQKGDSFYSYYSCAKRERRAGCDNHARLSCGSVEKFLLENLEAHAQGFLADISQQSEQECRKPETERAAKVQRLKSRMAKLRDLYLDSFIDREEFNKEYEKIQLQITQLESIKPDRTSHVIQRLTDLRGTDWRSIYKDFTDEQKRIFWRSIISRITVNRDGTMTIHFI